MKKTNEYSLYWALVNTIEDVRKRTDPLSVKLKSLISKDADSFVADRNIPLDETGHNFLLVRARLMQNRVVTLLTQWLLTSDNKYRTAALQYITDMRGWKYWSWITMRAGISDPDAVFDLSYGENSATLAIAFDMLRSTLTEEEKSLIVSLAMKWSFASVLKTDKPVYKDWWFKNKLTNWNTVCAGGVGMLALVLKEEYPHICNRVLERVEESIVPYMKYLDESDGGWTEGIGYWGYGMRYAFMYLLSYEKSLGKKHPLLKSAETARTIDFPLDFMPDGEACSFGDVNKYWVLAFHYAAACRFGRPDVVKNLDNIISRRPDIYFQPTEFWPNYAETLLLRPAKTIAPDKKKKSFKPVTKYCGMDWYTLKDKWPSPALYLSIRGGTTEVNHGHMDLTSFHCVVNGEALINNIVPVKYIDSTFSARRYELPETNPSLKNVVLINGLGVGKPSTVESKEVKVDGNASVLIDYTKAMGKTGEYDAVQRAVRVFIMIGSDAVLIVDSVAITHPGQFESRIHTYGQLELKDDTALITGKREQLTVVSASTSKVNIERFEPFVTEPGLKLTSMRNVTSQLVNNNTLFTLLTPGKAKSAVEYKEGKSEFVVDLNMNGKKKKVKVPYSILKI
ncbi:MAG: hypothetical protein JNL74_04190 [Fibrobacteres bacterium]|nr:hypothetical protein [Fibrobacterota bacterium]